MTGVSGVITGVGRVIRGGGGRRPGRGGEGKGDRVACYWRRPPGGESWDSWDPALSSPAQRLKSLSCRSQPASDGARRHRTGRSEGTLQRAIRLYPH